MTTNNKLGPRPSNTSEISFARECFETVELPDLIIVGVRGKHGTLAAGAKTFTSIEAAHDYASLPDPSGKPRIVEVRHQSKNVRIRWN